MKTKHYMIAGTFFLLLQLSLIYANRVFHRPDLYFWFCNHVPILFAVAFFTRSKRFAKALINIGFLVQLAWTMDFVIKLTTGTYLVGVTRYVFESMSGTLRFIPIGIHVLSTIPALLLTYRTKPDKKILYYSFAYLVVLLIITLTLTPKEYNLNCTRHICGLENLQVPFYTYLWPILVFVIIVLPTQGVQYFFYWLFVHRKEIFRKKSTVSA